MKNLFCSLVLVFCLLGSSSFAQSVQTLYYPYGFAPVVSVGVHQVQFVPVVPVVHNVMLHQTVVVNVVVPLPAPPLPVMLPAPVQVYRPCWWRFNY